MPTLAACFANLLALSGFGVECDSALFWLGVVSKLTPGSSLNECWDHVVNKSHYFTNTGNSASLQMWDFKIPFNFQILGNIFPKACFCDHAFSCLQNHRHLLLFRRLFKMLMIAMSSSQDFFFKLLIIFLTYQRDTWT